LNIPALQNMTPYTHGGSKLYRNVTTYIPIFMLVREDGGSKFLRNSCSPTYVTVYTLKHPTRL